MRSQAIRLVRTSLFAALAGCALSAWTPRRAAAEPPGGGERILEGLGAGRRLVERLLEPAHRPQTREEVGRGGEAAVFPCADTDGDGQTTLTDAVYILNHLFRGGPAPRCGRVSGRVTDGAGAGTQAWVWALPRDPNNLPGPPVGPFATDGQGNYAITVGNNPGQLPPGDHVIVATSVNRPPTQLGLGDSIGVYNADGDTDGPCPMLVHDEGDFQTVDAATPVVANITLCELCVTVGGSVPPRAQITVGLSWAWVRVSGTELRRVWSFLARPIANDQFTLFLPGGQEYLIDAAGIPAPPANGIVSGFYDADGDGSNDCPPAGPYQPTAGDLVAPACGVQVTAPIDDMC